MQRAFAFAAKRLEVEEKLVTFLKNAFKARYSAKSLKKVIESGACRVNGIVVTFASHQIKNGDKIEVVLDFADQETRSIRILFEDEHLLIIDKPEGLAVDEHLKKHLMHPTLYLVHRLDKETSGVLILAKDLNMQKLLTALFEKRQVQKRYLALVDGLIAKEEGVIDKPLSLKKSYQGGKLLKATSLQGASAITKWKRLSLGEKASLLLCEPITGRTHQIRVHLSSFGHPILGDKQYGKKGVCKYFTKRQLLHAYSVSFFHPITQDKIEVKAELPDDFQEALKALEMDSLIQERLV